MSSGARNSDQLRTPGRKGHSSSCGCLPPKSQR